MNHLLRGVAQAVSESFHLPGPILEVGSYMVQGQEHIADLRPFFPGREFIGMDMRPGPGVDLVAEVESIPRPDASVGTVIALSTFEHVRRFWRGFEEIHRILRPDGALLVAAPFYFHIHDYPSDYWRFTPAAFEVLLDRYPSKILGWHGSRNRPANVWALAFKEEHPAIKSEEFAQYQRLVHQYAREPLSFRRRLAYRVAGWFVGRGPFAPFLDHNRVESVCKNS